MSNAQYLQILDQQKANLDTIEAEFNKLCDQINLETVKKLQDLPKDSLDEKKKILQEHETSLAEALHNFKEKISASQKQTRLKLEKISEGEDEKDLLELTNKIENLAT